MNHKLHSSTTCRNSSNREIGRQSSKTHSFKVCKHKSTRCNSMLWIEINKGKKMCTQSRRAASDLIEEKGKARSSKFWSRRTSSRQLLHRRINQRLDRQGEGSVKKWWEIRFQAHLSSPSQTDQTTSLDRHHKRLNADSTAKVRRVCQQPVTGTPLSKARCPASRAIPPIIQTYRVKSSLKAHTANQAR